VFGDRVIATAILDRLLHHAITVHVALFEQVLVPLVGQPFAVDRIHRPRHRRELAVDMGGDAPRRPNGGAVATVSG
jgi:hypothetical protein